MNIRARAAFVGVILTLGAALGCNNIKGGGSKRSSSTAPASTAPPTSTTTTNPPVTITKAPTIAALSTSNCMIDGGARITITGTNFAATGAGVTLVVFGVQAAEVRPTNDTTIDMSVPASFKAGLVDVRVVNANGVGILPQSFTYTPHAASVAFLQPVGHNELGLMGTKITLACKDFMPITKATTVTFGGKAAASIALVDSKTLVAEVPDGLTAGPTTIAVTENAQTVSVANFLVQGALNYGDLTINEFCPDPSGMDCNNDGSRS
ncbi:MAG: IPT/TIG domain-containing protein, partial [Planctomycetota bacterium]